MSKILIPWTKEQVDNANYNQGTSFMHPYTCGTKEKHKLGDNADLVATTKGWVCPSCDYKQNWAHDFTLNERLESLQEQMEKMKHNA